jgi:uncharacterized membrane protein YcaP (DUF421 family)
MTPAIWTDASWSNMFQLTLSLGEKMLRPTIVYFFLVVALRLFGKRELAQLNPFDLVVLLLLSNTVQNAIIGNDNTVSGGLLGAITLFVVNYLVVRFLFRQRRLDQLVEGKPTILIKNGKVVRSALAKELLSESELLIVAHRQGFSRLGDIESAVLEPGGAINLTPKSPSIEEARYNEIVKRLDELSRQLAELKPARA